MLHPYKMTKNGNISAVLLVTSCLLIVIIELVACKRTNQISMEEAMEMFGRDLSKHSDDFVHRISMIRNELLDDRNHLFRFQPHHSSTSIYQKHPAHKQLRKLSNTLFRIATIKCDDELNYVEHELSVRLKAMKSKEAWAVVMKELFDFYEVSCR